MREKEPWEAYEERRDQDKANDFWFPIFDRAAVVCGEVKEAAKQILIALLILFALIHLNPFK